MLWLGVCIALIGYLVVLKLLRHRRMKMIERSTVTHRQTASSELKNSTPVSSRSVPPKAINNCTCTDKHEEWNFDKSLGCWYVERECLECEYYWEGPYYLYDDPEKLGSTLE